MEISTNRTYYIYEDNKIKEFIIKDVRDGEVVSGYIKGEGNIHLRGVSWLQENPEKLRKRYTEAMKYFSRRGNKRVKTLKSNFPRIGNEKISDKVVILNIYTNDSYNEDGAVAHFISNTGIVYSAAVSWFEEGSNSVMRCGVKIIKDTTVYEEAEPVGL